MANWRKLWNKSLDNTFLASDNNAWIVFSKLLLLVNNNGEYSTTTRDFAQRMGLSYSACMRTVDRLQAQGILVKFATIRGRNTIFKFKKFKQYQGSGALTKDMGSPDKKNMSSYRKPEQEPEQRAEQLTTDMVEQLAEQRAEQEVVQRRSRGGAERPKLQGSKKPLDIDNRNIYRGFEIFDVQLLDEIKSFIDYRVKKNNGLTQRALDLNIADAKRLYPDDVEAQKACINQTVARGWSGIFKLREEPPPPPNQDGLEKILKERHEAAIRQTAA